MTARVLWMLALIALLLPASAAAMVPGTQHPHPGRRAALARRHAHLPVSAAGRNDRAPITLALAVAERYWRAVPCEGRIAVRADAPLPSDLSAATDAWVTFDSSLGANNLAAPPATYSNCVVSLARWQWPTVAGMKSDWGMFCLTVVHELGHLLGHPHSLLPKSVMAPVFTDESDVPRICATERP